MADLWRLLHQLKLFRELKQKPDSFSNMSHTRLTSSLQFEQGHHILQSFILFWGIPYRSAIQVCVCVCCILTLTSGTRVEEGRACLGRKKEGRRAAEIFSCGRWVRTSLLLSQVSERTKDCCHGHLVTRALLGFADNVQRHQVSLAVTVAEAV